MKGIVCLLAIISTVLVCCKKEPTWEKEPDGYRDVKFGQSEAYVVNAVSAVGCNDFLIGVSRMCTAEHTIGAIPITNSYVFELDKLVAVLLFFDAEYYDSLKAIFNEKYGLPMDTKILPVQNKMGATFQNEKLTWTGKVVEVSLEKYGFDLTQGSGSISMKEWKEKYEKQSQQSSKDAAKDF